MIKRTLIVVVAALTYTIFPYTTNISGFSWPQQRQAQAAAEKIAPQPAKLSDDLNKRKPVPTSLYPAQNPAGKRPMLTWTAVPGAVSYEIELLSRLPENPNGLDYSRYQIMATRNIYAPGYHCDLLTYFKNRIYWRVRALDFDGNPLGVFSDAQEMFISARKQQQIKPLLTADLNYRGMPAPLYPVYAWIPVAGVTEYEVELLRQPPENPNGATPSAHRIWSKRVTGFDCYDDEPRITPGKYYWRVRGIKPTDEPAGFFSDTAEFVVDLQRGNYAATLGDSITHGGGDISHHPADWEYDYQTYLAFPTVNLGKSGDTSRQIAERFSQDVLPYHPRYLIILAGTNSLRSGTPADEVIQDLTSISEQALAAGIRPIFLTIPPINPNAMQRTVQAQTVANWQQEYARVNNFIRRQPYYIDIAPYLTDTNGELPLSYSIDGLHPGIEAKKLIASIINANWDRVTR
ncbi:hypothetical protein P22_1023 [Propionispora sp. 2/2-37]|uniref:SGNH/GDSL hydrolase family protein n=1 Tax=Propionispora sp. 2/2-37 TaxID=1677858 RepID=UPI0006BB929D|nr:GDSL-type esterase/lipase family protein [Propionispora sp. 2/2-37]CUH94954.1 hypothetical protein P22_1023 [Propionispora sp. 2/2-37]